MKNLIILIALVFAAYQGFNYWKHGKPLSSSGDATLLLFTSDVCHQPCADARALLDELDVGVEEVLVSNDNPQSWERLESVNGGSVAPLLITRTGRVEGFSRVEYLSAIADSEGLQVLPGDALAVLGSHFEAGEPKLVMYATAWCPYCAKARKYLNEQGIAYEERDVEQSAEYGSMYRWLNSSGYPLIYYGAKRLQGFDSSALQAMLRSN